ncbi:MAG: rhomboid family intramembrane serine protease [Xanthobacteraceae bacterium]
MFIPLYDYNPLRTIKAPLVTRALIACNVIVFVTFQSGLVIDAQMASVGIFGVIPAEFHLGAGLRSELATLPEPLTLVSYMFLHGGWIHLLGNMLFLWVFGDNVEDAMGHARFLVFYLACGVAGGAAHAFANPTSEAPLIGASAAVAGTLGAYLILHPKVKLWVLAFGRIPLKLSAMWVIGAWILFQFVNLFLALDPETAYWAHFGGLLAGAILVPFMRRPGVPLFDRGLAA